MKNPNLSFILLMAMTILAQSCSPVKSKEEKEMKVKKQKEAYQLRHPDWSKNATIYELNVRQFSEKGDFQSILPELDRIHDMGISLIWLMPIHPIGEEKRKGELGSYYAVQDYKKINPEFGTEEDFRTLVNEIHKRDMKVIIDWVANHTAWDNPWIKNDGWHTKDSLGKEVIAPVEDWTDVADLNYDNPEMRAAMIDALKYWVTEFDIDGYRCDVASMVPTDFWNEARIELDQIKPVFMLAEAEEPEHHEKAFDMSYAWNFMHVSNELAKGEKTVTDLRKYLKEEADKFDKKDYRMYFTTNHDENSWNGTVFERYEGTERLYATMAYTFPGMPLLYSGQEAENSKRLEFFKKDNIDWGEYSAADFYTKLLQLNRSNKALWNGQHGGKLIEVPTSDTTHVFAYKRTQDEDEVLVLLNFSDEAKNITVTLPAGQHYQSLFDDDTMTSSEKNQLDLPANGYKVWVKQ